MNDNMAITVLQRELDSMYTQIENLSQELKFAKDSKAELERAILLLGATPPAELAPRRRGGTSMQHDAMDFLQEGRPLSTEEILQRFIESGRQTQKPSVVSVMSRLKQQGLVTKRSDNNWYLIGGAEDTTQNLKVRDNTSRNGLGVSTPLRLDTFEDRSCDPT